ncbi:MAG: 50S ribosomal protein L13 [Gammaproteobacteria bacterium]|nr:50S ribosomal protein L13 [Gammaproteobacteria bacterium]
MNLKTTKSANAETVKQDWFIIDATDKVLGRLCSEVARRLRGKHKTDFTPHVDTGDYIIVTNAAKIRITGNKANDKMYYRTSGQPGKLKETTFKDLLQKDATRPIEIAVKGMMPRGPMGRVMLGKLKVYAGSEHPHTAQQPQVLEI